MSYYVFLGKYGQYYKLNANCPQEEKIGNGPGSCGGNIDAQIKRSGSKFVVEYKVGSKTVRKSFDTKSDASGFRNRLLMDNSGKRFRPIKQVSSLSTKLFDNIIPELNILMNNGDATCPGAAYGLAKIYQSNGIPAKIVGGEFNGSGHYWVEVPTEDGVYIADIGNNILEETLESGKIKNIFIKRNSELGKLYTNRDEKYDSPNEFKKTHSDPFSSPSIKLVDKILS